VLIILGLRQARSGLLVFGVTGMRSGKIWCDVGIQIGGWKSLLSDKPESFGFNIVATANIVKVYKQEKVYPLPAQGAKY